MPETVAMAASGPTVTSMALSATRASAIAGTPTTVTLVPDAAFSPLSEPTREVPTANAAKLVHPGPGLRCDGGNRVRRIRQGCN